MSLRSLGVSVAKSARTFQVYTTFGWVILLVFAVAAIGAALSRQPGEALRGLAEVIKVAAWPTVVAVLLLAFRDQIAAQFPRITKLSSPVLSIEISIEQQLSEAKQDAVGRGVAAEQVSVSDVERASAVDMLVTQADLPQIRARFEALADEYESIRSSMPSSDDRTRAMGVITAQMRAPRPAGVATGQFARAAYPLRWEFAFSRSSGRRLATLAMLQIQPDLDMLEWVAGRVSLMEARSVQYHALQALLAAVRLGERSHATQVIEACRHTEEAWKTIPHGRRTDREDLLKQIREEVTWAFTIAARDPS